MLSRAICFLGSLGSVAWVIVAPYAILELSERTEPGAVIVWVAWFGWLAACVRLVVMVDRATWDEMDC